MNDSTIKLITILEGLFSSQVKMAEAHGLDTLPHISTARGREILMDLRSELSKAKLAKPKNGYFNHLDKIHA
jgi:hypothetical protein